MLKALRHHPLMVGTAEVLVDAARYVAIMLVVFLLLGQLAKVSCSIWQFTGSEGLDEAYVPFFGAFGAAWDDAMVAHCSASPLGMPLAGDGRCVLGVRWEWRPARADLRLQGRHATPIRGSPHGREVNANDRTDQHRR